MVEVAASAFATDSVEGQRGAAVGGDALGFVEGGGIEPGLLGEAGRREPGTGGEAVERGPDLGVGQHGRGSGRANRDGLCPICRNYSLRTARSSIFLRSCTSLAESRLRRVRDPPRLKFSEFWAVCRCGTTTPRSGDRGQSGSVPTIYKICPTRLWREAERAGVFRGAPIDHADGYIHFSTAAQVAETARALRRRMI